MTPQASIDIVSGIDTQLINELIELQRSAYPPQMQDQDPERYYREALNGSDNVNVVLRSPEGKLLGYLLGLPLSNVYAELRECDPEVSADPATLYLDIVQTYPESRLYDGFGRLLAGACDEARQRGYRKLSLHVRTKYGLHLTIRRLFPGSRSLRLIENWWRSGETFEYIEAPPHPDFSAQSPARATG